MKMFVVQVKNETKGEREFAQIVEGDLEQQPEARVCLPSAARTKNASPSPAPAEARRTELLPVTFEQPEAPSCKGHGHSGPAQ